MPAYKWIDQKQPPLLQKRDPEYMKVMFIIQ